MRIPDPSTPVVVLRCGLGALAIARYLGTLGVDVFGVDPDPRAPASLSRFLEGRLSSDLDPRNPERFREQLLAFGSTLGRRAILIPTTDHTAQFVADHADALAARYDFPRNDPDLVASLVSKQGMFEIARRCGVPTPATLFPRSAQDVEAFLDRVAFPLMLKGIDGARLQERTGTKMMVVRSATELMRAYAELDDPADPNLMLQEFIPGDDDQVFIFNGYFDAASRCLAGFTGHKIRQFPVHVGCASLGVCTSVPDVATMTTEFMARIGYRGVLDIGYRLDARDGLYKVLDVNPRVGQAYRLFVARNGLDSVRCLYLDLTGQPIPECVPREGRRWVIEDMDLISAHRYRQEKTLTLPAWIASFRRVEEFAWFHWRDPRPFFSMSRRLLGRARRWWRSRGAARGTRSVKRRRVATVPE